MYKMALNLVKLKPWDVIKTMSRNDFQLEMH